MYCTYVRGDIIQRRDYWNWRLARDFTRSCSIYNRFLTSSGKVGSFSFRVTAIFAILLLGTINDLKDCSLSVISRSRIFMRSWENMRYDEQSFFRYYLNIVYNVLIPLGIISQLWACISRNIQLFFLFSLIVKNTWKNKICSNTPVFGKEKNFCLWTWMKLRSSETSFRTISK